MDDSLKKVIQFFKDHTFSHVAVVEKGKFVGLLNENDLKVFDAGKTIADHQYSLESFFVTIETNWLDVLEVFAHNEANLLPVINDKQQVTGYYDLTEIVHVFIDTPFFTEPGSILMVEKGIKDYSFSEIAQIVESNNTRFIGGLVTDMHNDVVQVTLKIGTSNLNEIIQSFRRYNYNIVFGNNNDQFIEDLKQRSDYLDKYLNV
jgi:CBS domain-containing protein